ncbi:23S rRNA (adenine(2503)-C(2))-methyltransferase RlmN [Candidatus Omnitrophota bacterium]
MNKSDIRNLSYDDLVCYLKSSGLSAFRADQIFKWLYQATACSFDEMQNLSKEFRSQLSRDFTFEPLKVIKKVVSDDGTVKVLFELEDKERIETVLIPSPKRATVCLSTQVGCKYGCKFCASGVSGFKRNLTVAEILGQVLYVKRLCEEDQRALTNVVFMGVGEPFDNYENLMKAIGVINHHKGCHIAARRITISTCGLIDGIKKLAGAGKQCELSVSLHAADDALRDQIMPVNKKYPLAMLMKTLRAYCKETNRQVTFEYLCIKDVTCTIKAARQLSKLLKGLLCKVNLIVYNQIEEFDFKAPSRREVNEFRQELTSRGIIVTLRQSRGVDIDAACGQLRHANRMIKQ